MRPTSWVNLTLGLVVVGTVLQLGGIVAPAWIFLEPDHGNYTIGVGLYYRVGCESSSGDVCPDVTEDLAFGYTDDTTYDKDFWPHLTWTETLGGVMALLLIIMMVVYRVGFGAWKWLSWLNNAMFFVAIFTWIPIAAGLILYAIEKGEVITKSPDVSSVSFPWSALLCFIAAIIFIIVTFLIRQKCRLRRYVKHAIPPSADTKMILNPSTKSQLINRFFTPSPYREDRRQALQSSAYYGDQSALLGNGTATRSISNGYANRGLTYRSDNARVLNGGTNVETRVVNNDFGTSHRLIGDDTNRQNQEVTETNRISVIEDVPYNFSKVIAKTEGSPALARSTRIEQKAFQDQILQRQQLQQELQLQQLQQQREQDQRQSIITRTTTTTANNFRNGIERSGLNTGGQRFSYTQPDLRPQPDFHSQALVERRQDERIYGNNYGVNRQGEINTYGANRMETDDDNNKIIIYTGRHYQQAEPRPLQIETGHLTSGEYRNVGNQNEMTRVIQTNVYEPHTEPVVRDQVYFNEPARTESSRFFRVGADANANEKVGLKTQYTSHIKSADVQERGDRVVLAPSDLLKDANDNYNNKYIYRPFNDQMY